MNWRLKSREQVEAELSLYNAAIGKAGGSYKKAAVALGIANANALASRLTRLRAQAERGEYGTSYVIPTFAIKSVSTQIGPKGETQKEWVKQGPQAGEAFEVPEGHTVKGISALVDGAGRTIQQWVKTGNGPPDPAAYCKELEEHFSKFKPAAKPVKAPKLAYEDQLTLYPWSDPHFGLMVWHADASENWDLKISVKTIRETFAQVVARTDRKSVV